MELWVRSQNKQKLTKVNELNIFDFADFVVVRGCNDQETSFWLGNYKTEERALEVLDEIQNILKPKTIYTQKEPIEIHKLGAYQIKQILDMETQEMNTYVYEMPEE